MKSTDSSQSPVDDAFAAESRTLHDASPMMTFETRCDTRTRSMPDFVDVTDDIQDAVRASEVRDGRAVVLAPTDACSIMVNERESGLLQDLKKVLARLTGDGPRPHALLGSSSVVIPIQDGRLHLGTWQRVLLVELKEPGERWLDIEIIGET